MDVNYEVAEVYSGYAAQAQFRAVLWTILGADDPLCRRRLYRGSAKALHRLRLIWWEQLHRLEQGGWRRLEPGMTRFYAQHCAPFGVQLTPAKRGVYQPQKFCSLTKSIGICPWCWARAVLDSYERFHFALYDTISAVADRDLATGKDCYRPAKELDLLEIRHTWYLDRRASENNLQLVRKALSKSRLSYSRGYKSQGTLLLFTIEPARDPVFWRLKARALMLLPRNHPISPTVPAFQQERGDKLVIRPLRHVLRGKVQLTRKVLMRAVARTWIYPARLLNMNTEVGVLLHLISHMQGFRSFSHTKLLRNLAQRRLLGRQQDLR